VVIERAQLQALRPELRAEDVAPSAGVRQQVMDGDRGGDVPVAVVGEVLAEGVP